MSLVAYYKFEDSPGFLNDSSGNGNTLTNIGATMVAGGFGKKINKISGNTVYASGVLSGINESPITLMGYFFSPSPSVLQFIDIYTIRFRAYLSIQNSSGAKVRFKRTGNSTSQFYSEVIDVNKYYHLTLTCDNSYLKGYINGNLINIVDATGYFTKSGTNHLGIGTYKHPDSTYAETNYYAYLDEIRLYNEILPQSKIKQIYSQLKGIF